MTRQKIVWLANEGGHHYGKAEKFGRLMPLTSGNVNYFNLDRLMVTIAPKLKAANAEDYLLVSGSPILVALIVSMWLTRFPHVNLLQWAPAKGGDYVCIPLRRDAVTRMSLEQSA